MTGVRRAVVVGHDWGAIVAWHLAMTEPDRVHAVVGMSVPFAPRTPLPPLTLFLAVASLVLACAAAPPTPQRPAAGSEPQQPAPPARNAPARKAS